MSSRYSFALATEKDDAELRKIIRNLPMEGSIRIIFQKEPNFFTAERIGAKALEVLLCREQGDERIVGFGSRSVRRVFVNGKPEEIGYLSSLRAIPEVRGGTLLPRAYKALRELHRDGKVPFYFTTIFDENEIAKKILTSGRAGLPAYRDAGVLDTYVAAVGSCKKGIINLDVEVIRGTKRMLKEIVGFLNSYNAQFQFAPYFEVCDFEDGVLFPGFAVENFYAARVGKSIIGIAGVWDQSSIKQTIVDGYSRMFSLARPFYNMYASLSGRPLLPAAGKSVRSFYVPFLAIEPREPEIFRLLLRHIYYDFHHLDYSYFTVGFNSKDPMKEALLDFTCRIVKSRIYSVSWEDGQNKVNELDGRMACPEIATL